MSARFLFILAFSTGFPAAWIAPASADPVSGLHAADVPVHDQGAETRAAALKDALAQVLVKMTGSQSVLKADETAALLQNPARFLQQYRYEAVRPAPADPAVPRLALHAEFDGAALEQRLRASGFPLWGRERPLTLAWVAFSDGAARNIVGSDVTQPISAALQRAATRRSLPLALPAMDPEDATRVSFTDVWGVYEEPLLAAASRYSPDAVLVGSIFNAGDGLWASRWALLRDGQRQRWELSGASPEAVATAVIDALTEHYAEEFAVQGTVTGESAVLVEVTGVPRLRDYAAVQSYLSGLSAVKDAHLLLMDGDTLRFELELNGGVRALEQTIALGRVLEALPASAAPVASAVEPTMGAAGSPTSAGTVADPTGGAGPNVPLVSARPLLRYRYRR